MADDLNTQCSYTLHIYDEKGEPVWSDELGGRSSSISWRMPPQAIQIERSIRADVIKDLSRGITITQGGEGLGRLVVQGTHGVGAYPGVNQPSLGRDIREQFVAFFQAFMNANDLRGANGKTGLVMVFEMLNGSWSNPENESYIVWPDSFPKDSRSAGRPNAWDWSLSFMILGVVELRIPPDPITIKDPAELQANLAGLESVLQKAMDGYKRYKATMQSLKDLKNAVASIRNRVAAFRAGAMDNIYEITDLVRGSSQLGRDILRSMDMKTFTNDVENAIRGAVYEARALGGQAILQAHQFARSGAIQRTLTAGSASNRTRPVSVGISAGDSVQSMAAKHLGSASSWVDLVKVNGLVYPYFDFSGPGGRPGADYAGMAVLGATDSLKLPLPASSGITALPLDPIGTDYADVPANDGALLGGIENLRAALIRRLLTPKGRIPQHPEYGSFLDAWIGSSQDMGAVVGARREVIQTLKADPRVSSIESIEVSIEGATIKVDSVVKTALGLVSVNV